MGLPFASFSCNFCAISLMEFGLETKLGPSMCISVTAEDFDQALEKVNDVLEEMYRNAPSAKDDIHLKDPELEELCIERF